MSGSIAVLNINSNLYSKDFHCDDLYLSASKNIKGTTAINFECQGGTINIGADNDTVNLKGTVNNINATNLSIQDKLIQINANASGAATCRGAGFNFRDDDTDGKGYIKTSSDGKFFEIKAVENAYVLSLPDLSQNATVITDADLNVANVLLTSSNLDRTKISAVVGDANKFVVNDGNGLISAVSSIARNKIAADEEAKSYVIINDSDGNLSKEQRLAQSRGGLGCDASQISNSKYLFKNADGDIIGNDGPTLADGSVTNAKIASDASIDRSKIAVDAGNMGCMLFNDNGTGAIGTNTYLSQSGSETLCSFLRSETLFSGFDSYNGSKVYSQKGVQSNSATPVVINEDTILNNTMHIVKIDIMVQDYSKNCGYFSGFVKVKCDNGTVSCSDIYNKNTILDSALNGCDFSFDNATANKLKLKGTGLASTDLYWNAKIEHVLFQILTS